MYGRHHGRANVVCDYLQGESRCATAACCYAHAAIGTTTSSIPPSRITSSCSTQQQQLDDAPKRAIAAQSLPSSHATACRAGTRGAAAMPKTLVPADAATSNTITAATISSALAAVFATAAATTS